MAFTFNQYPILTPEQANPMHLALKTALQNYTEGVKAKYSPRMMEADIFHKTISPLANLAISPMFLAMNPEQQSQITAYISQMLQNSPVNPARGNTGQPNENHNGLLNNIKNLFGGNNNQQPNNNAPDNQNIDYSDGPQGFNQNGDPIGSDNGDYATVEEKNRKRDISHIYKGNIQNKFTSNQVTPGNSYVNEKGDIVSRPDTEVNNALQKAIIAIPRLKPILDNIAKFGPEVIDAGPIKTLASNLSGLAQKSLPSNNIFSTLAQNYLPSPTLVANEKKFNVAKESLENLLIKNYGRSQKEAHEIVNQAAGEGSQQYQERLSRDIAQIFAQGKQAKGFTQQGIVVNGNNNSNNLSNKNTSNVHVKVKAPEIPANITNAKDFQAWKKTLTAEEQLALQNKYVEKK
jgi:hypothetical protein